MQVYITCLRGVKQNTYIIIFNNTLSSIWCYLQHYDLCIFERWRYIFVRLANKWFAACITKITGLISNFLLFAAVQTASKVYAVVRLQQIHVGHMITNFEMTFAAH